MRRSKDNGATMLNTTTGVDRRTSQSNPENPVEYVQHLIGRIWVTEQLPEKWKEGRGDYLPIHKKGD